MSRFAQESPERQIPWLPGERFELALDSQEGALNSSTAGTDTLTVTTHRVIRLTGTSGAKVTELVPLDRLSAVQVLDVSRDQGKLINAIIAFAVGVVLFWLVRFIVDPNIVLFELIAGGLPALIGVYLLTGWLFPDEEGALLLHTPGHTVRQPLLSEQSRHDAYLVAHRVYELMARAGSTASRQEASAPKRGEAAETIPSQPSTYLGQVRTSTNGASPEVTAVMSTRMQPDETASVPDLPERIARVIERTSAVRSYATHQILRDPGHEGLAEGDYVWDMEHVAPDRYRVSQTGWSEAGEVNDRWMVVGADFYRDTRGTWQRSVDPERFSQEQTLSKHLAPSKYLDILRQGYPSAHEVDSGGGKRFLQLEYATLTREALASVLANPSPPQGVAGSAKLWVDMETDLLAKAEVRINERDSDRELVFEQAFAAYDGGQQIEPPVEAAPPQPTVG